MILKSLLIILGVTLILWGISACIIMKFLSFVIKNEL